MGKNQTLAQLTANSRKYSIKPTKCDVCGKKIMERRTYAEGNACSRECLEKSPTADKTWIVFPIATEGFYDPVVFMAENHTEALEYVKGIGAILSTGNEPKRVLEYHRNIEKIQAETVIEWKQRAVNYRNKIKEGYVPTEELESIKEMLAEVEAGETPWYGQLETLEKVAYAVGFKPEPFSNGYQPCVEELGSGDSLEYVKRQLVSLEKAITDFLNKAEA